MGIFLSVFIRVIGGSLFHALLCVLSRMMNFWRMCVAHCVVFLAAEIKHVAYHLFYGS